MMSVYELYNVNVCRELSCRLVDINVSPMMQYLHLVLLPELQVRHRGKIKDEQDVR